MALFLQDQAKKKEECDKILVEWRDPEAVYLGHRRWVVSLDQPRSLIMSCPDQVVHFRRSVLSKFRQDAKSKLTNGFFRRVVETLFFLRGMTALYFRS